jgi:ribose 5-phosphate isomerase B
VRIALASDEAGALSDAVAVHLEEAGHTVVRPVADGSSWPDVGRAVGEAVVAGDADVGVVCCWTGTGVAMAATKVRGVRAALCTDAETAAGARRWNDANVLALSIRLTTPAVAEEVLDAFLSSAPDPEERPNVGRLE